MSSNREPAIVEDHLIAGMVAGAVSSALLLPLDLIKVHLQVYDRAGRPFPSMLKGLQSIVQQEGYRGLYKGLTPALLANGVSWGGYFLFYEHAKNRYLREQRHLTSVHHLLSAFEAGIIMVFLTNPLWLIKTRMQLQPGAGAAVASASEATAKAMSISKQVAYTGLIHAVRTIVKEEGPLGLYKGMKEVVAKKCRRVRLFYFVFVKTLFTVFQFLYPKGSLSHAFFFSSHPPFTRFAPLGLFPALLLTSHGAIQFVTYEWLKKATEPYQMPLLSFSFLGGLAKVAAGLATYPSQVIKARLQQRETGASRWRYTGTWDCIVKIWQFEGALGFFKGCVPNVLKTAPSAAITFLVYEQCMITLNASRGTQRAENATNRDVRAKT
jgi:solute carrier family 25 folate transporter 32